MPVAELRIPIAPELDAAKVNGMISKFTSAIKRLTTNLPKIEGDALGINGIVKEVQKLSGEFDQNSATLNKLASDGSKALAQMLAGGQKNTVQFQQMLAEVTKNVTEVNKLKDAQAEIDKLTGAGGGQDQWLQRAANVSMVADGLGRAGDAVSAFADKGTKANDALRIMQAQTGATAEDMELLGAQADDAFRSGVGGSLDEAIKKVGFTRQILKDALPVDQIAAFTTQVEGMGKVFDKDFNEIVLKSGPFLKQFGLDGKAGADLVALGLRDATTSQDDFLDTLSEYSNQAKEAGLSSQEFIGILTKGGKEAAFNTDKILDSIKETGIRLDNMDASKALGEINGIPAELKKSLESAVKDAESGKTSTMQLLGLSAEQIKKAVDAGQISQTMAAKLQTAIAGTPSEDLGREMYRKIFSGEIDAKQITDKASKAGNDAINAISPVGLFDRMGREIELLTTKASQAFAPIISGAGDALKTLSQLGPGMALAFEKGPTLAAKLLPMLTKVTAALGLTAVAETGVGTAATASWSAVLGPLIPIIAGVGALVAAFVLAYKYVDSFREGVDGLVRSVEEVVASIINWVTRTYQQVKPALEEVAKTAMFFGKILVDWITLPIRTIVGLIGTFIGWIGKLIGKLFESQGGALAAAKGMNGLQGAVSSVVDFLKNLRAEVAGVGAALSFAGGAFADFALGILEFDQDKVLHAFDDFFGRLRGAYEKGKQDFVAAEERAAAGNRLQNRLMAGLTGGAGSAVTVGGGPKKDPPPPPPVSTDTTPVVTAAAKALAAYNKQLEDLNSKQQEAERKEANRLANAGQEQTLVDQILLERERLKLMQQQLALAEELSRANANASKEDREAIDKALEDARSRVTTQDTAFATIRAKIVPEIDEAKMRELERERLKLQIELGARPGTDMLDFLRGDLEVLESDLARITAEQVDMLNKLLAAGPDVLSQDAYNKQIEALNNQSSQAQVEALNALAAKRKEIRDIEYAAELKALERAEKARDRVRQKEAEAEEYHRKNLTRLLEEGTALGIDTAANDRLARLEDMHDRELISDEAFESRKSQIEAEANERRAAAAELFRGAEIEAERQAAARQLAIQQDALLQRRAAAEKAGDMAGLSSIDEQLGEIETSLAERGNVLSGLAVDLQGNLTEVFTNLLSGDEEKVKDPFRRSFGILAGALQQLATAKITEVLLGSLNGLTGIPGMLASFASAPLISAAVNGILSPILKGLLSFPTGGRVDAPTLAMVGDPDPARFGTSREWMFRDDQLRELLIASGGGSHLGTMKELQAIREAVDRVAQKEWVMQGKDIALSQARTRSAAHKRVINPRRG